VTGGEFMPILEGGAGQEPFTVVMAVTEEAGTSSLLKGRKEKGKGYLYSLRNLTGGRT